MHGEILKVLWVVGIALDGLFLVVNGLFEEFAGFFLVSAKGQGLSLTIYGAAHIALILQNGREALGQGIQQSGSAGKSFFGLGRLVLDQETPQIRQSASEFFP